MLSLRQLARSRSSLTVLVILIFIALLLTARFLVAAGYVESSAKRLLRQTLSINATQNAAASQALLQMGDRADPVLIWGLLQDETPMHRFAKRMWLKYSGTRFHAWLPSFAQHRLIAYLQQGNADPLRFSAARLIQSSPSRSIGPQLLPLLTETNQLKRAAILGALLHHLGPDNVTAAQLAPLALTVTDTWPTIRLRTALCLADAGPAASSQLPLLRQLCADPNLNVRLAASWLLDRLSHDTAIVPLLATNLAQSVEHDDSVLMGWEIWIDNLEPPEMRMAPLTQTIIHSCLTNSDATVRGNACLALIPHPRLGHAAVPVLASLLNDPDPKVRKHAASALRSIQNSGP